jgi:hypothetical protein
MVVDLAMQVDRARLVWSAALKNGVELSTQTSPSREPPNIRLILSGMTPKDTIRAFTAQTSMDDSQSEILYTMMRVEVQGYFRPEHPSTRTAANVSER